MLENIHVENNYIKSLEKFNSGMKETESNRIEVDFDYEIMECLVDFIYTGEMTITSESVYGLYQASDFYEIETARSG